MVVGSACTNFIILFETAYRTSVHTTVRSSFILNDVLDKNQDTTFGATNFIRKTAKLLFLLEKARKAGFSRDKQQKHAT